MIVFISDTHFGVKQSSKTVFKQQVEFYQEQFFPFLREHKKEVDAVILPGDLFHFRNHVDNFILQGVKTQIMNFFDEEQIKLYILVGNHDMYYKDTREVNSLEYNFREYEYVEVVNEFETKVIGKYKVGFSPWIVDEKEFKLIPRSVDVLVGHFEIKEFLFDNPLQRTKGFLSKNEHFKDYPLVISGHFHNTMKRDNILYVGSPYQMDWGDHDKPKGFYLLKDKFELEYVKNTVSANFVRLHYHEIDGLAKFKIKGVNGINPDDYVDFRVAREVATNNYCHLVIHDHENKTQFDARYTLLQEASKDGYKIERTNERTVFDVTELGEDYLDEKDVPSLIKSFISGAEFSGDIEKDALFQKMIQVYDQAINVGENVW